jgi:hypothetical protein
MGNEWRRRCGAVWWALHRDVSHAEGAGPHDAEHRTTPDPEVASRPCLRRIRIIFHSISCLGTVWSYAVLPTHEHPITIDRLPAKNNRANVQKKKKSTSKSGRPHPLFSSIHIRFLSRHRVDLPAKSALSAASGPPASRGGGSCGGWARTVVDRAGGLGVPPCHRRLAAAAATRSERSGPSVTNISELPLTGALIALAVLSYSCAGAVERRSTALPRWRARLRIL